MTIKSCANGNSLAEPIRKTVPGSQAPATLDDPQEERHKNIIEDSWQRCDALGLCHNSRPSFGRLSGAGLDALLDQHRALINTTQKEVLPFYENILSHSNCIMLLADRQGHVLHTWHDRRFSDSRFKQLAVGNQWTEAGAGTNAIGTALAVGDAVQVGREEHFLRANRYMVGSAAPIFDTAKEMVGVLDISSDAFLPQDHTLGLVKLITLSVENRLIFNAYARQHLLLSFSNNASSLASPWSGLLAVNTEGRIITANRRAEVMLARDLKQMEIEAVFDRPLREIWQQPKGSALAVTAFGKYRLHLVVHPPQQPGNEKHPAGSYSAAETNGKPGLSRDKALPDNVVPLEELEHGDQRIARLVAQASRIMEKDIPILLHGETGCGKEVLVRSLHFHSSRRAHPLVAVNCAAIPSELVESELFGYEKGAFTGANTKGAIGLIRKSHKGTLFLDEIGEMPLNVQARLLRVLQERCVCPLGSTESYPVDIKLISATNRDLKSEIEAGCFRGDLYYRIAGLSLEVPALRQRGDKRALIEYVHRRQMLVAGEPYLPLKGEILDLLARHPWPGNVRQLISVLGVAVAMADGEPMDRWHLPDYFFEELDQGSSAQQGETDQRELLAAAGSKQANDLAERVMRNFKVCNGNVSRTAKAAGVSRNTVYKYTRAFKASSG